MLKSLRRIASAFLIAVLLAGTLSVTSTEAAVKKPTKCRFTRWNTNSSGVIDYTSCRISWKKAAGLDSNDYYEIKWTYPSGRNFNRRYQYSKYNVLDIDGLSADYVYKVNVRSVRTNGKQITGYSAWSNAAWIVPLPRSFSGKITNKSKRYVEVSWNKISGACGYRVYVTTSPSGKWYLRKTINKVSKTSVTLKKYRGSRLKKYKSYYVRVVPVNMRSGRDISVPLPSSDFWSYRFYLYSY